MTKKRLKKINELLIDCVDRNNNRIKELVEKNKALEADNKFFRRQVDHRDEIIDYKNERIQELEEELYIEKDKNTTRQTVIDKLSNELNETVKQNNRLAQKNLNLSLAVNSCYPKCGCGCTSFPKQSEEVLDAIAKRMAEAMKDHINKEIIKKPDRPMLKYKHSTPDENEFVFYSKKQWNEMLSNLMWRIADQPKIDNEWALCSIPNLCDCQKDKINKLIDERVGTTIRNIIDIVAENKKK